MFLALLLISRIEAVGSNNFVKILICESVPPVVLQVFVKAKAPVHFKTNVIGQYLSLLMSSGLCPDMTDVRRLARLHLGHVLENLEHTVLLQDLVHLVVEACTWSRECPGSSRHSAG